MIDEKVITHFVPAQAIEAPLNTYPEAKQNDKIRLAIRRFISSGSFSDGEIIEKTPRIAIISKYFDPQRMGYDVIARIL